MDENSNVANELREAVKKAFAEGKTASNFTEMVVLPTKQVIALVEENDHLREENSNLVLTNNTQNAELGLLRKDELDRCGDMNGDAVLESLKEMAVKAPNMYVNRVLGNAIRLILQLKDENKQYVQEVNDLHELNTSMVREIIKFIKLNGTLSYGGYVIHDSTIDQICKKYGVEVE